MKHGKNPTRKQQETIKSAKLDPEAWLVVKDTLDAMELQHRENGTLKRIGKRG